MCLTLFNKFHLLTFLLQRPSVYSFHLCLAFVPSDIIGLLMSFITYTWGWTIRSGFSKNQSFFPHDYFPIQWLCGCCLNIGLWRTFWNLTVFRPLSVLNFHFSLKFPWHLLASTSTSLDLSFWPNISQTPLFLEFCTHFSLAIKDVQYLQALGSFT